jgi:hypothetical protein
MATLEDLKNDILKATDQQEGLMRERRPLLGSKKMKIKWIHFV